MLTYHGHASSVFLPNRPGVPALTGPRQLNVQHLVRSSSSTIQHVAPGTVSFGDCANADKMIYALPTASGQQLLYLWNQGGDSLAYHLAAAPQRFYDTTYHGDVGDSGELTGPHRFLGVEGRVAAAGVTLQLDESKFTAHGRLACKISGGPTTIPATVAALRLRVIEILAHQDTRFFGAERLLNRKVEIDLPRVSESTDFGPIIFPSTDAVDGIITDTTVVVTANRATSFARAQGLQSHDFAHAGIVFDGITVDESVTTLRIGMACDIDTTYSPDDTVPGNTGYAAMAQEPNPPTGPTAPGVRAAYLNTQSHARTMARNESLAPTGPTALSTFLQAAAGPLGSAVGRTGGGAITLGATYLAQRALGAAPMLALA